MEYYSANQSSILQFTAEGYVVVPGLLSSSEIQLLSQIARQDAKITSLATSRSDATGGTTTLALSNELPDDVYGAIVRSRRVAENMAKFLGDEVYHYHHKMMLKEPRIGGAWEWHQDYGYWYNYGCLWPAMASCYIAVDPAKRENGCLQVIPKSHHLGRIDHVKIGGQTGADPERVAAVLERLPKIYVEMQPGDALFFHGNLLHCSDQNHSEHPRWALICCYNTRTNDPYQPSRHPNYSPLDLLDDQRLIEIAQSQLSAMQTV